MNTNRNIICGLFAFTMNAIAFGMPQMDAATANYFANIQKNPAKLQAFLHDMPKGGELHDHLGGASMAENMIIYAQHDHFCLNLKTLGVDASSTCPPQNQLNQLPQNSTLYNSVIDAWSMRHYNATQESAHDHCFAAFGKFSPIIAPHSGEILAEMAERAAEQNEQYLEVMITPDENASGLLGKKLGWQHDPDQLRQQLLTGGMNEIVSATSAKLTAIEAITQHTLQCATTAAKSGCGVKIRYLYQVYREQPPEQVFAQLLAGFELAAKDPRVVGINLVQAENGTIALRDYHLQMQLIGWLHQLYPAVHISLHAGESGPGVAPLEALRFHIREAIELGAAERIGHGLDINYEDQAEELFNEMAEKHILVETTPSTELILGFDPSELPLPKYLSHHVPVAISTDDEGVFRTNLTEQFANVVSTYSLSYATVKNLVRNSIAYSFLPGRGLWSDDQYQHLVPACQHEQVGDIHLGDTCKHYLAANEKAQTQWQLEQRFAEFERQLAN